MRVLTVLEKLQNLLDYSVLLFYFVSDTEDITW